LIRLDKLLHSRYVDLLGRQVRTASGTALGQVTDYSLHCEHLCWPASRHKKAISVFGSATPVLSISPVSLKSSRARLLSVMPFFSIRARQNAQDEFDYKFAHFRPGIICA